MFGDSTCGQRAVYQLGQTGIPVFNVNNNCSTGSSALMLGAQAVAGGMAECVLVVGFEQMEAGALSAKWTDRANPLDKFVNVMNEEQGFNSGAARRADVRRRRPRVPLEVRHQARDLREDQREGAPARGEEPVRAVQGGALRRGDHGLARGVRSADPLPVLPADLRRGRGDPVLATSSPRSTASRTPVYIAAQAMTTDFPSTFEEHSMIKMVGYDMAKACAKKVYEQAGIGPEDVEVVELHDCFTANELLTYEALGLCKEGEAEKFIWDGDNTYGGKFVTNPSGGLLSKGHPLGATGLAQCTELVWQLRGQAEARQVEGAKVALQHNLGLGGACVVTMYRKD